MGACAKYVAQMARILHVTQVSEERIIMTECPEHDARRDPDAILRHIAAAEAMDTPGRGKLKIFFGYAAGVGKTFAMLEQAHEVQKKGFDVVVGYVEPHTRVDTLALLDGLEQIPPLERAHRGITLREFDLDRVLARHPQIVLVDELAHTNAPGGRHRKRFQDVEELLRAGINVFTTVNVQHLETLNDKIAAITEVRVAERIPDAVFDHATSVELIDIEPDDLIERLESGKVYLPDRARTALAGFFTKKNLGALREIALRRMADRMTRQSEAASVSSHSEAGEEVLAYVTADPGSVKVIRAASNLAEALHGSFTVLVIESNVRKLSSEDQAALRSNVELAEVLGAHVVKLYGDDMASQISQYCVTAGITQAFIGSSSTTGIFSSLVDNLVSRLTRMSHGTNINVVPIENLPVQLSRYRPATGFAWSWGDLLKALGAAAIASAAGLVFFEMGLSSAIILTLYMLVVVVFATRAEGFFYSLFASMFSMLAYNFFFTTPRFTFDAYGLSYPFIFAFILITTMVASSLTVRMRRQTMSVTRRAYRTEVLFESSRKLQTATNIDECFRLAANQIIKLLNRPIVMYRLDRFDQLGQPEVFDVLGSGGGDASAAGLVSSSEEAVATWAATNNESAGATTDTLREAKCLYLPIHDEDRVFGVAGLVMEENSEDFGAFEKNLLYAILDECGQASARLSFVEERRAMEIKMEKESLRSNLLRTISHDLRTPLTSISGDAHVLLHESERLSSEQKQRMYRDIFDDSNWLISLVENLLSVTRFDDGTMEIEMQPEIVDEVIHEALRHVNRRADDYKIETNLGDGMLMASMDARLIMQVIINLVNNALTYTPAGSRIVVGARSVQNDGVFGILISVADDGPGMSAFDKERVFDMFYNGTSGSKSGDSKRGMGLGLALCRSIVRAHKSDMAVSEAYPQGCMFSFTLPAVDTDKLQEQHG